MAKKWSWQNSVRAGGRGSGRATPGTCGDVTLDRFFFNFIYLIEVNCSVISLSVAKRYK